MGLSRCNQAARNKNASTMKSPIPSTGSVECVPGTGRCTTRKSASGARTVATACSICCGVACCPSCETLFATSLWYCVMLWLTARLGP